MASVERVASCAAVLVARLTLGAGCTLDEWANGTWRVDPATMDAVRTHVASSGRSPETVELAARFRLDLRVPSAIARFEDDGEEPVEPFRYTAENAGLHELELTAATRHAAWPTSVSLRCNSLGLGACPSVDVISSEPFFVLPAPIIVLVREP